MKNKLGIFAVGIISAVVLTACTQEAPTSLAEETSKEAGTLGSRICFTNATDLPMTAAPSQQVDTNNADHIVGEAGAISDNSAQCYAGWNSYSLDVWKAEGDSTGFWTMTGQDVALSVGIDGDYNVLNFRANNESFRKPSLYWTANPASPEIWSGNFMSEGESIEGNAAGHKFIVSRLNDSQYYKEFAVRFTQ